MKSKIFGVSLGPGDPELITIKALKALQEADIIYCPAHRPNPAHGISYKHSRWTSTGYNCSRCPCQKTAPKPTGCMTTLRRNRPSREQQPHRCHRGGRRLWVLFLRELHVRQARGHAPSRDHHRRGSGLYRRGSPIGPSHRETGRKTRRLARHHHERGTTRTTLHQPRRCHHETIAMHGRDSPFHARQPAPRVPLLRECRHPGRITPYRLQRDY